ncbi:MAG: 50S ribosomal protein L6 [Chlamydiae bacterium RIFCSPHIGHO2_12_FULL_49_11]|nr:MAG: 50S ribosomal protein L6 [Chlamydiae bacterium RIFCSPHIGHO2_12_FULL_49_11]
MSRLAKKPIHVPPGVEVTLSGKSVIQVKGPRGSLKVELHPGISASYEEGVIALSFDETKQEKSFYGLDSARVKNAVTDVVAGYTKKLELVGVGYRAALRGNMVEMTLGYSHPVQLSIPQGVKVEIDKNTVVVVSGFDRQVVGQFAASLRAARPPEPYKGKGIRYDGEQIVRKAGKSAKK